MMPPCGAAPHAAHLWVVLRVPLRGGRPRGRLGGVVRGRGRGQLRQDLGQVTVDPVGFSTDLDGDVPAFGDESVIDGGELKHDGGAFPF